MGLPRNDDDDEKKPWTHSCFELSLGHHLPNYRRGASAYVCVCVYAIITTFSKHLRPPEPVFIAGKGMGQHSLGRLFWKMGEGKKNGGLEDDQKGVCRGTESPQRPTDRPVQLRHVEREMSERFGFLWENGLWRLRSAQASRTGFHNSERVRNTEKALWAVTEMERLDVAAENHLTEYITEDLFPLFYPYTMAEFHFSCLHCLKCACV